MQNGDGLVIGGQSVEYLAAAVRTPVVHVEDFKRRRRRLFTLLQDFDELIREREKIVPFILDGDDDGDPRWLYRSGHEARKRPARAWEGITTAFYRTA
jgi:hypothetical protein